MKIRALIGITDIICDGVCGSNEIICFHIMKIDKWINKRISEINACWGLDEEGIGIAIEINNIRNESKKIEHRNRINFDQLFVNGGFTANKDSKNMFCFPIIVLRRE